MQRENKGITLIALVITIIVMLILVGVTISVSLNGGLFTTAKQAEGETQIAQEKEQLLMAALGTLNENGKVELGKLDSSLPEGFTGTNGEYTSKTGNVFKVSENGSITLAGEQREEQSDTPVTPPATNMITFSVNGTQYSVEEGVTWDSWIESDGYNYGFSVDDVGIVILNNYTVYHEVYDSDIDEVFTLEAVNDNPIESKHFFTYQ